jgi:hypothetical protein
VVRELDQRIFYSIARVPNFVNTDSAALWEIPSSVGRLDVSIQNFREPFQHQAKNRNSTL